MSPQCGVSCLRRMTIPVRVKRLRTRWQREALSRKRTEAIQSRSPRFVTAAVFVVATEAQYIFDLAITLVEITVRTKSCQSCQKVVSMNIYARARAGHYPITFIFSRKIFFVARHIIMRTGKALSACEREPLRCRFHFLPHGSQKSVIISGRFKRSKL